MDCSQRKSTRLVAVAGGLVTSLGCLFTSFASQWHQVFISYGLVMGVGVGMVLDTSTLMLGQYFKRRRELLEILIVSGRGVGVCLLYTFVRAAIRYFILEMFSKWPFKDCARVKITGTLHIKTGRMMMIEIVIKYFEYFYSVKNEMRK